MKVALYNWVIYPLCINFVKVFGIFHSKTRKTIELRSWKNFIGLRFDSGIAIDYWIHVASAGELEYAIPVIKELNFLKKKCLVSYYSISAKSSIETLRGSMPNVSLVVPLPHDGLGRMSEFVDLVHQQGVRKLLLFKYELWPGLILECKRHGIKVFLVDALKPSWIQRKIIHNITGLLSGYKSELQDVTHDIKIVTGDSRVERVIERCKTQDNILKNLMNESTLKKLQANGVVVFGSMWGPDNKILLNTIKNGFLKDNKLPKFIFWVPHEIHKSEISKIKNETKRLGLLTVSIENLIEIESFSQSNIDQGVFVIVSKKGFLAELYQLSSFAYVGGGFGKNVHSVWEPFIVGNQVACGPNFDRSPEAKLLQASGFLTIIKSEHDLTEWIKEKSINNKKITKDRIDLVVAPHLGASKRIIDECEKL